MTRRLALVALLALTAAAPACGKYGKPVRTSPAQPAGVAAQPSTATQDGEACEEDAEKTDAKHPDAGKTAP